MTEHIKVEESYVESLIKNAAWDAASVSLVEAGKKKAGQSKGDEPKGKAKEDDDKPDFTTDARKGDKSKTHKGKDFEKKCPADDDDEVASREKIDAMKAESVEEHVCPLCETVLEEALSDEQIYEHVAQISQALETIEEQGAHHGVQGGSSVAVSDLPDEEKPEKDDTPDHPSVKIMAKVKELKKAAQAGK